MYIFGHSQVTTSHQAPKAIFKLLNISLSRQFKTLKITILILQKVTKNKSDLTDQLVKGNVYLMLDIDFSMRQDDTRVFRIIYVTDLIGSRC